MRRLMAGVFVLSLGSAAVAAADPVTLTSGSLFEYGDGSLVTINASGAGFAVLGSGVGGGWSSLLSSGQRVTFSRSIAMTPRSLDNGSLTVGSDTHRGFVSGSFQFNAAPFVVPNVAGPLGGTTVMHTSFGLTGTVQLFSSLRDPHALFTQDVSGSGTLAIPAEIISGGLLARAGEGLTFTAGATPSATPEPASMLLLGTGLLAAWRSRRLRQTD